MARWHRVRLSCLTGEWVPLVLLVVLSAAVPAEARQSDGKWEIEFHGGVGVPNNPTDGTGALPAPGATFTTARGRTSRHASSWYFGDGASLLNEVSSAMRLGTSITALDPVLKSSATERKSGGAFGFRVSRSLTSRWGTEFTLDYSGTGAKMTDTSRAGIEATAASFISAVNGVLAPGPFTNRVVTSEATINDGSSKQLFTTGAVTFNLLTGRTLIPYLAAGAGMVSNFGDAPSVTLIGNYRFLITGLGPINETDTVSIRSVPEDRSLVGVLGGGVRYNLSPRWGIRGDVRWYLGSYATHTTVDANPVVAAGTPAGSIETTTTPSLQFSNSPRPSSLSGAPITGFTTFAGSGMQASSSINVGVTFGF